ncbi:DUF4037 domain-containing protein [Sorangium sp. So ce1078]|uniref:DUF4037 domain-containing protein n=1 Tax=Sorangium sp. So ce1078 TaxID=3133329 RepID=UPI003F61B3F3
MPTFISGIDLARKFYTEVVESAIDVPHAACLLGEGSEVLGYDQPRSTDHAWGPRLQIFVDAAEVSSVEQAVDRVLPSTFMGWPVRFYSWQSKSVRHHVDVTTLDGWVRAQLGFDPRAGMSTERWLAVSQQNLLQVTSGAVFRDDSGQLTAIRKQLAWYPSDVWLWMMASQWHLIGNSAPLIGRTAEASDLMGSALVASRMVRLAMELGFLQERRYWPYPKWFGTAFTRLGIASTLAPLFHEILTTSDHRTRADAVVGVTQILGERHNRLGFAAPAEVIIGDFQVGINGAVRPYRVLDAGKFVEACKASIQDDRLRELVTVGSIDQLTHGDDALINFTTWPHELASVYGRLLLS